MENEWFYSKGEAKLGPVSREQLRELARSGQLAPDDMIWQNGMVQWVKASSVKGLFASAPISGPPLPSRASEPQIPTAILSEARPSFAEKSAKTWRNLHLAWKLAIGGGFLFFTFAFCCCGIGIATVGRKEAENRRTEKEKVDVSTPIEASALVTAHRILIHPFTNWTCQVAENGRVFRVEI